MIRCYKKITLSNLKSKLFQTRFGKIQTIANTIDEITKLKYYEFKKKTLIVNNQQFDKNDQYNKVN